jgi:hypothetical protein
MRTYNEIISKADILSNLVGNSFPASGGFLQKMPVYGPALANITAVPLTFTAKPSD